VANAKIVNRNDPPLGGKSLAPHLGRAAGAVRRPQLPEVSSKSI